MKALLSATLTNIEIFQLSELLHGKNGLAKDGVQVKIVQINQYMYDVLLECSKIAQVNFLLGHGTSRENGRTILLQCRYLEDTSAEYPP